MKSREIGSLTYIEIMGIIGMSNDSMVVATIALSVSIPQALTK